MLFVNRRARPTKIDLYSLEHGVFQGDSHLAGEPRSRSKQSESARCLLRLNLN